MITPFFPSQIIEYIDRKYPHAINGQPAHLTIEHLPVISVLIKMIEQIPPYIVNLRGNDFTEFIETLEAIRATVTELRHLDGPTR